MLQKAFERLVDLATGTFLIEMELPEERRKMVDRLSELNGVKPSTVLRVIAGEALLKDPPFKGSRPEESNSTGAT